MTRTRHSFFQKFCACAGMAALLFVFAQSSVLAQEAMPESDTSAPAMQRIHNFTHKATELAMTAMTLIGSHYKYGGNSPETGIDCSGLVRYVFKEAWGATLPRTSLELSRVGEEVSQGDLQPGDLVFYNTRRRSYSHVGIYLGDNKFIHAPSTGKKVRIDSMDLAYWKSRFNGARRITNPEERQKIESEKDQILQAFRDDAE